MNIILQFCLLVILTQVLSQCREVQESEIHILRIDSSIKKKAIEIISYKDNINVQGNWFYSNLYAEYYTNDKMESDSNETTFRGKYYWKHDTLSVSIFYGDLGTMGFVIDIAKDTTGVLYFSQCGHIHDNLKLTLSDTLSICAKVPCTYSELIISKFPDDTQEEVIFGYVDLKSANFYYENGKEPLKIRRNMKFYFRASFDFYRSKYYKSF